MNNWTNEIINRLDTAYNARFEKEKSLAFLNDASSYGFESKNATLIAINFVLGF